MSFEGWRVEKLKNLTLKIGSGATPRGGKESYKESGISFIRSQNVLNHTFSPEGLVYIDDLQAERLNNVTVESEDILLNITGDSVARCCIVPSQVLPARVNQHVCIIRCDKEKVLPSFVKAFLCSPMMQSYMLSLAYSGGTRPALTKRMIEEFDIQFPSIEEQERIVSLLSSLDEKIELNHQINQNLEEMAQAIFKSWFTDFEPFQDGEFVESELGMIPKGWRLGKLGELISISSGKRPKDRNDIETTDCNVPLIGASTVVGYVKETLFDEPILVIGRVGTHGVVQRFKDKSWPSDNTLVIRSDNYEFIHQLLKTIDYKSLNRGSTQPLVTQTDIKNINVIIPTGEVMKEFEELVSPLFQFVEENQAEIRLLGNLRDTLLPKLMSGEIRVPLEDEEAI